MAQGACNVALLFTDATRVSFLTQASIAFTPVLVSLSGDRVGAVTWAGCFLAISVVLLGFDGGEVAAGAAAAAAGLNLGDVIALIGGELLAVHLPHRGVRQERLAREPDAGVEDRDPVRAVPRVGGGGSCAAHVANPAGVAAPWAGWQNPAALFVLIFTAVVPGYFADVCQAKGQESVDASESQVLLAGEPLFAAVMGAVAPGREPRDVRVRRRRGARRGRDPRGARRGGGYGRESQLIGILL